jgi:hypothetical protein
VSDAFRAEEKPVVQIIVSLARVENERQIQADTTLERQEWLDIVRQRPRCVFIPDNIKPGDQIRKFWLAILLDFLSRGESGS